MYNGWEFQHGAFRKDHQGAEGRAPDDTERAGGTAECDAIHRVQVGERGFT